MWNLSSTLGLLAFAWLASGCGHDERPLPKPNILIVISDDQSFPHAGAYGTEWIKTPAFDRVAREGILFTKAYTPNAKCAPSRSCLLTGRNPWQLEEAANHVPFFPAKFKTYAEVLREQGYFVGFTGKGWAPGDPGTIDGKKRELLGPVFNSAKLVPPTGSISPTDYAANFREFLGARDDGQPFCFWFGSWEPHRPYDFGSGLAKGDKRLEEIDEVLDIWPDEDSVRTDLLDYAFEIEHFDRQLAKMLAALEEAGELDNTLIVVTSDNGMAFPRVKGQAYGHSNHVPLAMMWRAGISDPGRTYDRFVSFTDFAPTLLDVAQVSAQQSGMATFEGNSLRPVLDGKKDPNARAYMVVGKERHDVGRPNDTGYPIRGIITDQYLYLQNFEPDRWPAGNPETGYLNTDGSATKSLILHRRRGAGADKFWDWSFGKRPAVELYDLSVDATCIHNLAANTSYLELCNQLQAKLESELKKEGDPRILGDGHVFDTYRYADERTRNFYERLMSGEQIEAKWVNKDDFESDTLRK